MNGKIALRFTIVVLCTIGLLGGIIISLVQNNPDVFGGAGVGVALVVWASYGCDVWSD